METTETPTDATPPEGGDNAPDTQTVPYERFAAKVGEIKALEEQLIAATQAVDTAAAWEVKHEAAQAALDTERASWGQTEALLRAGVVDGEVAELARWRFEKSGEDDFAGWLDGAAKEDPLLKSHLAPTPPAATAQAPPPAPPSPNNGAQTAPPPRGEFSPEAVQAMSVEDVKKNYARIASAWGYRRHEFK